MCNQNNYMKLVISHILLIFILQSTAFYICYFFFLFLVLFVFVNILLKNVLVFGLWLNFLWFEAGWSVLAMWYIIGIVIVICIIVRIIMITFITIPIIIYIIIIIPNIQYTNYLKQFLLIIFISLIMYNLFYLFNSLIRIGYIF